MRLGTAYRLREVTVADAVITQPCTQGGGTDRLAVDEERLAERALLG